MKLQFIRKGQQIRELNAAGNQILETKDYGSINAAKRASRKLQGTTPGQGLLQVEKTSTRSGGGSN